jgi:hypothetical protein
MLNSLISIVENEWMGLTFVTPTAPKSELCLDNLTDLGKNLILLKFLFSHIF